MWIVQDEDLAQPASILGRRAPSKEKQPWSKFGSDDFPSAKDTQFGEDFQSSLMSKVEKDTAPSKAVAITKRSKREKEASTFSSQMQ